MRYNTFIFLFASQDSNSLPLRITGHITKKDEKNPNKIVISNPFWLNSKPMIILINIGGTNFVNNPEIEISSWSVTTNWPREK